MHINEFFYFQKSDRSVLIVLLLVAVISTAVIHGIGSGKTQTSAVPADSRQNGFFSILIQLIARNFSGWD